MPARLRSQLALVIAVAMAPAGLVAILQAIASANDEIGQREAVFASEMRTAALRERDALQQVRSMLAVVADEAEQAYLETGQCGQALTALAEQRPDLMRLALLDARGRPVCGAIEWQVGADIPDWQQFVADPRPTFVLDPGGAEDGSWDVIALHPTVFLRPEAFGVATEADLRHLRELSMLGTEGRVYGVIDSSGALLAETAGRESSWLPRELSGLLAPVDQSFVASSRAGGERLYVSQPIVDGQLWAVASVPRAGLLDVVGSAAGLTVLGPILLWLIAVVVAYVSIDKLVTRHVAYLSRAASRIGTGDLGAEIRRLDNAPREIRALGDAIRDMAGNLQDRDAEMREALERQKNLILEIHHRVKNNLQMVTSLINIQLRRARSPDEREALRFLEDRVQSLAVVHQHLYGSEELDRIPMDELVRDICERLKISMSPENASVEFRYQLAPLVVDSRIATPVALFLTEAISNVFKHAVPQSGAHEIDVMVRTEGQHFVLEIRNELEHAEPVDTAGPQGLGMRLLRSFTAQLGGDFRKTVDANTFRLTLRAPVDPRSSDATEPAFAKAAVR